MRVTPIPAIIILRKEVIQPQVPLRLPCYDLVPIAEFHLRRLPTLQSPDSVSTIVRRAARNPVFQPPLILALALRAIEPASGNQRNVQLNLVTIPRRLGVHIGEKGVAPCCEETIQIRIFGGRVCSNVADHLPSHSLI